MAFTGLFWVVYVDAQILGQRMMTEGGDWVVTRRSSLGYCGRLPRLNAVSHGVHWSFLSGVCRRADFGATHDDGGRWLSSREKIFLGLLRPFSSVKCRVEWRSLVFFEWCVLARIVCVSTWWPKTFCFLGPFSAAVLWRHVKAPSERFLLLLRRFFAA
mgnify:CR=1 FL=1